MPLEKGNQTGMGSRPEHRCRTARRLVTEPGRAERVAPPTLGGTILVGLPIGLYESLLRLMECQGFRSVAEFVRSLLDTGSVDRGRPDAESSQYTASERRMIQAAFRAGNCW